MVSSCKFAERFEAKAGPKSPFFWPPLGARGCFFSAHMGFVRHPPRCKMQGNVFVANSFVASLKSISEYVEPDKITGFYIEYLS